MHSSESSSGIHHRNYRDDCVIAEQMIVISTDQIGVDNQATRAEAGSCNESSTDFVAPALVESAKLSMTFHIKKSS